jgi:hypothetical protein
MVALSAMRPRRRTEGTIQAEIMRALNMLPMVRVWRNNVGECDLPDRHGGTYHVVYGLCPGSADLIGSADGRALAVEVKKPGKGNSEAQDRWQEVARELGWIVIVATSVEQCLEELDRARA